MDKGTSTARSGARSFASTDRLGTQAALEVLLLVGLGAAIVAAHSLLRLPLQLPGRHGVEAMALLILGRLAARNRWAATISSATAAGLALLPVWGFGDPMAGLWYLVPGPVIDLSFRVLAGRAALPVLCAAASALAYATKPLGRAALTGFVAWPFHSLLSGVLYPLATHLLFGAMGGLVGWMIYSAARRLRARPRG